MRTPRRRETGGARGPLPGRRGAALVVLLPLLAACGTATAEISPDDLPQAAAVTPDACSVVPSSAVATALAPASGAELPASSAAASPQAGGAALSSPRGVYAVTSVGSHSTVGQCTYSSPDGPTLIVSVFPKTTLAALADVTTGLRPLGPALVSATDDAGLITFQDGGSVVGIALQVGGLNQSALARRMGTVVVAVTGQPLPLPALSSGPAATGAAVPTALPAAGQQVTGATAAQTVQETGALKFDPASVTLSSGGVVQWTNGGSAPHNVTFDANPELTSGTMGPGDKYQVKFTRAGQYPYHCTFHPGMDGTVTVS
jgi:plastocyanin